MFQQTQDRFADAVRHHVPDQTDAPHPGLAAPIPQDDGLLATAVPIMLAAYGAALGIVALSLAGSGAALFAIVISAGYGAVYFGVPLLMARSHLPGTSAPPSRTANRRPQEVSVFTGLIGRREALLQMVIVPLAVRSRFQVLQQSGLWSGHDPSASSQRTGH